METSFDAQLADLKKAGASVRELRTEEVAQFAAVTRFREVQSAWADDQKRKGVEDAGGALAKVTSIMKDIIG